MASTAATPAAAVAATPANDGATTSAAPAGASATATPATESIDAPALSAADIAGASLEGDCQFLFTAPVGTEEVCRAELAEKLGSFLVTPKDAASPVQIVQRLKKQALLQVTTRGAANTAAIVQHLYSLRSVDDAFVTVGHWSGITTKALLIEATDKHVQSCGAYFHQ